MKRWSFWLAFAAATLLIAGVVSYFASSSPDGLDSATLQGCEVTETVDGETVKVIEFSPQDRTISLKSGKEGKRTRLAYSLTSDGKVVLYGIWHHDKFDERYR